MEIVRGDARGVEAATCVLSSLRTAIVSSETFVSEVRTSVGSEAYLPVRARWCVRSGARMRGASCSEARAEWYE